MKYINKLYLTLERVDTSPAHVVVERLQERFREDWTLGQVLSWAFPALAEVEVFKGNDQLPSNRTLKELGLQNDELLEVRGGGP